MTTISYLLTLLDKIPAAFWGVVVGSFFSITGIALTNRASDKRLRAQFEHEQMQKTTDREMALRKEVYLAAVEAIAAGTNAVSSFANLDIPSDQLTAGYIEKAPAIAKVHVIAKMKTVQALVNFSGELGAIFLTLFARRFELMEEKNRILFLDEQIAEFGKARDRYLEMITQHNIDGIVNDRRWQILQENFDFEQRRTNEAIEHRSEIGKSFYPKQLEFMRKCASASMKLGISIVPVLSAVREELELPFNDESYRQVLADGQTKQELAIDGFIQKFMTVIAEPIAPEDDQRP